MTTGIERYASNLREESLSERPLPALPTVSAN